MLRIFLLCLSALLAGAAGRAAGPDAEAAPAAKAAKMTVMVIPVRDEISSPVLYVLRRGLKEAEREKADLVVLDMKTPGGALDTTFDIMEALAKFSGRTITYVDSEAMSAGAFIAASTDEIWFTPDGVIGAAAPVSATGQDVEATMKQKVVSYLRARMRAISEGKGYRGQVVSAMIDADYELKIGDRVIKGKGELLSLTASEASERFGDPPQPLLAAGTAKSLDELLAKKLGASSYVVRRLEITWSERLAVVLNRLTPLLLGLGVLALFIEFKTPGFGLFGAAGIALLAVVFLGSYVAGLSGHEPALLFAVGVVLLLLELLFWHSAGFLGVAGAALMAAALLWSMADLWPNQPLTVAWSGDAFVRPLVNLGLGLAIAAVLAAALIRFLPRGWAWDRLVVGATVVGAAQRAGLAPEAAPALATLIGRRGKAVTALRPAGQVEIDARRYEARVEIGAIDAGTAVVVRGQTDFGLIVEKGEA
jgi:membrane-bound serine protease (ClpP class)